MGFYELLLIRCLHVLVLSILLMSLHACYVERTFRARFMQVCVHASLCARFMQVCVQVCVHFSVSCPLYKCTILCDYCTTVRISHVSKVCYFCHVL